MFDPVDGPRVFAIPLGVDFPKALVDGLLDRAQGLPPEDLARAQLIVNTRRMARRIRTVFDQGPPRLLPRIDLITDPGDTWNLAEIPDPVPSLKRRLELAQLVSALLQQQPDLAPRTAVFDLAESLANLMDEMRGENVPLDRIEALDVADQSGHWARIKSFLTIIRDYVEVNDAPDHETRQRLVVEALIASWKENPPTHPIIIAGSTGSRGTTQLLMRAVARLPQGAIILPGFDTDMPQDNWDRLGQSVLAEDHPQFRFAQILKRLDVPVSAVQSWTADRPVAPLRNKVVSLALRPAPVTDQWLRDGPDLGQIGDAFDDVTLIEAPSTRVEALAIAMRLKQAADDGETAALITPDRNLSRQVSAALDRWKLKADDSAGQPLYLSPPGRFLRHVAELLHKPLSAESLLTLLKHPLTHSADNRGPHLRLSRELELHLRRHGPPFPEAQDFRIWADGQKDPFAQDWVAWLIACFCVPVPEKDVLLTQLLASHIQRAEAISRGVITEGEGALWSGEAGRSAHKIVTDLAENAEFGGTMRPQDYAALIRSLLSAEQVRDTTTPHPNILIWGTLEARVQGADFLILAGLNEGSWPEVPTPDPWLNGSLRNQIGLLLPERRIGLSAHDFQQAVANKSLWLSRSVRSDDAETVPSRWLNRLQNLLSGLPEQGGVAALQAMRARGETWLSWVSALEKPEPIAAEKRPSPRPPANARVKQLSVTQIKTLIRDPYAIYARHILKLRPLDPLMKAPDALLRGIVVHKALENFIKSTRENDDLLEKDAFLSEVTRVLEVHVPWAEARLMWRARIEAIAERFLEEERARRHEATPTLFETRGQSRMDQIEFTLTAEADRIDVDSRGAFHIYDYKTGTVPSKSVQEVFDKQLLLEAAIATRDGFGERAPGPVAQAVFLGLGRGKSQEVAPLETEPPDKVWADLETLIGAYLEEVQGFTSRRALQKVTDQSDYDQLARFGEWDITDPPDPQEVG